MQMKTPDLARLQEAFWYEPETGYLYRRSSGKRAFATENDGRLVGTFQCQPLYAHRVAWALHTGAWPCGEIDHINGDSTDNRIANLRDVDRGTNRRNAKLHKNSRSGVSGICWAKGTRKWQAQIKIDRQMVYLGQYNCFFQAVRARKDAERELGFHPHHGRRSVVSDAQNRA